MDFDEIYQSYGDKILNLAYRMSGKEEVARDLNQDIFLKVYENMDNFREESRIYTWIYRIALNHIINYLKKEKRYYFMDLMEKKVRDIFDSKLENSQLNIHYSPMSPDKKLEGKEQEEMIWKIILKLPQKLRVPFVLHRYEDFNYKQISEKLGISHSNVETRIHRAKKIVIKELEKLIKEF
jgi:RNA polymerase sigma-70 factor (ECF subfamily)